MVFTQFREIVKKGGDGRGRKGTEGDDHFNANHKGRDKFQDELKKKKIRRENVSGTNERSYSIPLTCFIIQTLTVNRRSDPSVRGRVESQFHPVIPGTNRRRKTKVRV